MTLEDRDYTPDEAARFMNLPRTSFWEVFHRVRPVHRRYGPKRIRIPAESIRQMVAACTIASPADLQAIADGRTRRSGHRRPA